MIVSLGRIAFLLQCAICFQAVALYQYDVVVAMLQF